MFSGIVNAPLFSEPKFDISGLIRAVESGDNVDTLNFRWNQARWEIVSGYLQPVALAQGQVLIEQAALDRTLYFVESGSLSVHFEDSRGRIRLAIVGPGSVVGEGAFFSRLPRSATVQAAGHCKVWSLSAMRFTELSNRQPAIALDLVMGLGAVLAHRMNVKPRRPAVT